MAADYTITDMIDGAFNIAGALLASIYAQIGPIGSLLVAVLVLGLVAKFWRSITSFIGAVGHIKL